MLHEIFTCWLATLHKIILTGTVCRTSKCSFCVCLIQCYKFSVYFPLTTFILFLYSCSMCHSNKFECNVSWLLYDKGEVEYWMYAPVDLTEESATKAATGSTMQGEKFCQLCSACFLKHHPYSYIYIPNF